MSLSTTSAPGSSGMMHVSPVQRRRGRRMRLAMSLALSASALFATAAQAAPTTYQDFPYTSSLGTAGPAADKPQSKLWYTDGSWWALMLSSTNNTVHIFELQANHTWRDTGTQVDSRAGSTGDALWDASIGKLYVAS